MRTTQERVMSKVLDLFKGKKLELDSESETALRDMAGWPLQSHQRQGQRSRRRITTVQRGSSPR